MICDGWPSWGLNRETICYFKASLKTRTTSAGKSPSNWVCWLHFDGRWQKVIHLNKLYLRHVNICKNIKCTIRLSNAKCIIPCGHPFRLKCEMWSSGGQICRRWKSSLFISVLLINLNTAVHLADTETLFAASHRLFSTLGGCISISGVSTDFSDGERLNHRNRRFFFSWHFNYYFKMYCCLFGHIFFLLIFILWFWLPKVFKTAAQFQWLPQVTGITANWMHFKTGYEDRTEYILLQQVISQHHHQSNSQYAPSAVPVSILFKLKITEQFPLPCRPVFYFFSVSSCSFLSPCRCSSCQLLSVWGSWLSASSACCVATQFDWTDDGPDPSQPEGKMRQLSRAKQWVSNQLVTTICVLPTMLLS